MARAEQALWDECSAKYDQLEGQVKDWETMRAAYLHFLDNKLEGLDTEARVVAAARPVEFETFHALRRLMGIVIQEKAMLDCDERQLRAIGMDGAFVALGRGYVLASHTIYGFD